MRESKKLFTSACLITALSYLVFSNPVKVEDVAVTKKPEGRPSVALVLAGGGAKGFAELPIMEYIDQLDIPIDMIVGTSVGAIVGGFYSAGYSAMEIVNEFSDVDWVPFFTDAETSPYEGVYGIHGKQENLVAVNFDNKFSMKLGTGVSNGQLAYQLFKKLSLKYPSNMNFDELPIPFRAVATDMLTGDAIVLQDGDIAEAIRASMSLPAVFEPLNIDGYYFMDGGLRYNLPINVAKAMGYDIIIAIDISAHVQDNPEAFSSNPAVSVMNALTIGEHAATVALYDEADLIITPNFGKFGTLDFNSSKEIYESGKSNLEEFKPALENIRKRIYPEDYDENGNRISGYKNPSVHGEYRHHANLIPESLVCEGAYSKDLKYIKDSFEKIKGKELTPETFDSFLNDIYLTGNYTSVRPRVITENNEQYIRLQMKQKPQKELKILMGTDFEQIFTDNSATRSNLEIDLQARGFTGNSSMISLHGTLLNDYGIELYCMQPFDPYLFLDAEVGVRDDIFAQHTNMLDTFSNVIGFTKFYTQLNLGLRTTNSNLAKIGVFYNGLFSKYESYINDPFIESKIEEKYTEDSEPSRIYAHYFGGSFNTSFGTINSKAFATKGYYFAPTLKVFFPIYDYQVYNLNFVGSMDLKFAIPMGSKFSLNTSFKAGMDFTERLKDYYEFIPYEGFSTYDRLYFPSITSKDHFGTNLFAAKLVLQFKPKEHLTLLGGELLFRLEGTAGFVNYDWSDSIKAIKGEDSDYPVIWSGTFGVGLKINSNFNLLARLGACSTYSSKVAPLFCVDIGNFMF